LHKGKDWDQLAKGRGIRPETTDFFKRGDSVPKLGNTPGFKETAFGLTKDNRYPDRVFENEAGAFVIKWEAYEGIDQAEHQKENEIYRSSLMRAKHQRAFITWLEDLRKQADIEIVSPVTER
jgi:hypothetical protein